MNLPILFSFDFPISIFLLFASLRSNKFTLPHFFHANCKKAPLSKIIENYNTARADELISIVKKMSVQLEVRFSYLEIHSLHQNTDCGSFAFGLEAPSTYPLLLFHRRPRHICWEIQSLCTIFAPDPRIV